MTRIVISLFAIIFCWNMSAQQIVDKGVPNIKSFKNQQDKIYSHTWDIDEAPNHILYFVNDKGLLEYDGNEWKLYKGSKGITRSLKIKTNNLIYTGSDNDFGVWRLNENNEFTYQSLFDKIKNNKTVEEFWNVYSIENKIIFQSFNNLYIYDNGVFTIIKAPNKFIKGNQIKSKIYLIDEIEGLLVYDGSEIKKIGSVKSIIYKDVVGIDEHDNDIHIITKDQGIFSINSQKFTSYSQISSFPQNDLVFCYQRINQDYFALGTIQNGLLILNNKGNIIHKIGKTKGLQNNTVLSMHNASNGMLWLGLDFGIDALDLSKPTTYFIDYQGTIGTTYTALLDGKTLYLGTNQGLYAVEFEALQNNRNNFQFRLIPNSQGQVWTLWKENNFILVGHDRGLFKLSNNQLNKIDDKAGVLTILKFSNAILTGNYEGVHSYKINGQNLEYVKKIPELIGSFNQLLNYRNKIFALLPNEGVLEFQIDSNLNISHKKIYIKKLFGEKEAIQLSIKNEDLIVHTIDFLYSKSIFSDKQGFKRHEIKQNFILKNNLLQDRFMPISLNTNYELFSIYNGFAINDLSINGPKNYSRIANPLIRSVVSFNNFDKEILINDGRAKFKLNNILINYVSPGLNDDIEYQYSLEPMQKEWSAWDRKKSIEFLNLREGKYTFKLRSRNFENVSDIQTFTFKIKPPFYRSWWAYLIYVVLFGCALYSVRWYNGEKLKKQKLELLKNQRENLEEQSRKYKEKLEIERREKLELEQMQLKKTLENKELELAKKSIDQIEINNLITSIKTKFEEVQNNSRDKLSNQSYNDFIQFIDKRINNELTKEYEIAFDSSQTKLHETILHIHPSLTNKDLRICSYLLMNLSSKEIAKLMQVIPSSIDVSRSRLKKKMNLSEQDSLREYLANITMIKP